MTAQVLLGAFLLFVIIAEFIWLGLDCYRLRR